MERVTVNVSALAQETGETVRTIQHWSDLGILRPDIATRNQGRGRHRQFDACRPFFGERSWALIAHHLSTIGIPLGDMKIFIDSLRRHTTDHIDGSGPKDFTGFQIGPAAERCMSTGPVGRALLGRTVILVAAVSSSMEAHWKVALDVESTEAVKKSDVWDDEALRRAGFPDDFPREWIEPVAITIPYEFLIEFPAFYAINLSLALKPLCEEFRRG